MSLYEHKVLHGCVCVSDKSPLCRFTESDAEAGLCQRADITQHNLQQPSQKTQPRSLSTRPFPQISLTHTHTYTETITFTHSHRHTFMLMHKHTLMLLLIQAHTAPPSLPPLQQKINMHLIHYSTHGWARISTPISISPFSVLSFPFFVQIQDVKMFTLHCRHSDELIAVFDSRTEHGGEKHILNDIN